MRPHSSICSPGTLVRPRRALVLTLVCAILGAALASGGLAADVGTTTVTLGESNTDSQRRELLDFFAAGADAKVIEVTVDDTRKAMEGIFETEIDSAYSSTSLTCRELGDGLDVTTRNIEVVTPAIYALALVTAGVGDAELIVAAPDDSPAMGMTALTGVFKTLEIEPCATGNTNPARQRLALEQLTLTAKIGLAWQADGIDDAILRASNTILETQKTIINEGLRDRDAIDDALRGQEDAQRIRIPSADREKVLDVLERLANSSIDWSTFAKGWTIDYLGDNRITMRGDGIAIRNAQASATAKAASALTATAAARDTRAMTATAEALGKAMTATAEGQAIVDATATAEAQAEAEDMAKAQATASAIAGLTATAAARPTDTPVPTPTPPASTVTGKVVRNAGDEIVVVRDGQQGDPVSYKLDPQASVMRAGKPVPLVKVVKGDLVRLTVRGGTNFATEVVAKPAPAPLLKRLAKFLWIVPLGLAVPAYIWVRGRHSVEPFVLKRVNS